jgi:hypothetical protein
VNRAACAYSNVLYYREVNQDIHVRVATQQQTIHLSNKDQIVMQEGTSSKVGKYNF